MKSLPFIQSCLFAVLLCSASLTGLNAEETSNQATPSQPKERPKLTKTDLLGENNRLEVHGGASFTIGGGSGTSFREYAGWASFYDPVTGINLGVGYSNFSGKGLHYGYRGDYFDDYGYANFGYETFPSQRLGSQDQYSGQRRMRANRGRWHGQSTDVVLQLPLLGYKNFLTIGVSKEQLRSGD